MIIKLVTTESESKRWGNEQDLPTTEVFMMNFRS